MLIFGKDFNIGDYIVMEGGIVAKVAGRTANADPSFFLSINNHYHPQPVNSFFFVRKATLPEIVKATKLKADSQKPKKKKKKVGKKR